MIFCLAVLLFTSRKSSDYHPFLSDYSYLLSDFASLSSDIKKYPISQRFLDLLDIPIIKISFCTSLLLLALHLALTDDRTHAKTTLPLLQRFVVNHAIPQILQQGT